MRYEDASQGGQPADNSHTVARPDVDTLPPGSYGPAGGNTISGSGTTSGASGEDSVGAPPAKIVEVHGAGGATTVASGNFEAMGQFGVLTMDAAGNFNYVRNPNTPDGVKDVFNYTLADASGANSSTTLTIDIGQVAAAAAGQGVVALPAGVELSDIHVNGRDLIVDMPDGTQMVIPGGAVFVPQLMIGDVQVPPTNLAALLIDSEPQPAAGPPTSSGADWSDPVPPLDPGVPLGDLIPPTELVFTPPEFKEPGFFETHKPTVVIETPDNPAGVVDASESVNEKGLPGRDDGKPAGSGEIADGNPFNNSDPSETNTGTIVFTAPDGLQSVTVDGVAITAVGQTIAGQFGTMTITSINLASGQIGYSYTLADNTSGDNTQDLFSVVVTDKGGNTATGSLTVHIIDDVPTARNDTDSTDLVTHLASGNVVTGADTTSGSAGADTVGADNAQVTAVSGAGGSSSSFDEAGNLVVHGQFGVLTIHADGSYSYTENQGAPGGGVDTFTYTLTDGDGDSSTATLTITNPDHTPTVVIETPDNPDGVVAASESVFEKGLPARGGEPAGSGEIADGNPNNNSDTSETNTGTIVFNAQDGLGSITVDGTAITQVGQTIAGQFGTMTITSINLATGQIGYSYTLADNTSGDNTADHFTVVVTDSDGDQASATLTVHIVDDVPTAHNDTDLTDADSHVATGNVITGADTTSGAAGADVVGADDAQVTAIAGAGGTDATADGSGNFTMAGQFGTLTINQDGSYTYTESQNAPGNSVDTFTYTITDGDGDTSTATLTITNPNHVPMVTPNALVQLDDDALAGGNPGGIGDGPDAVNLTGTLSGSGGDGQLTWDLQTTGAPSGFSYVDGPNGSVLVQQVQDGQTVTVLTITVNAATGAYTVTQNAPIDHAPGGNENNADFTINYTVTDVDGDHADGSLNIEVNDDTPVVTLADTTVPALTVDETDLSVNATASFASDFTVSFGADGPATANSLTYTLGISASGADSGLIDTASGNHVFLFVENGEVVGREGATATAAASGPVVFTVTVDGSGNVTLDQVRAVVHPDGTNPDTSEGVSLASGDLVTLTATATDHDGDTASQSLNLGNNLVFQDDGPTISASSTQPVLTVDETNLTTDATASFAGVFASSFGADGAGSIAYTLGISAPGADSGLIDTATGQHIFLVLNNGVVEGHVGSTSGALAFTVSVAANGDVTLDQIRAVVHPDTSNPNDSVTLGSDGLVTLTGTITDKDGDSSTATANIGQNLVFQDDGPTISATGTPPSLTVDETDLSVNATASIAGVFTSSFGADGAGTITYALGISSSGADSGIVDTATGNHVFLFLENGEVVGREGTSAAAAAGSGPIVFTVSIDGSGNVTLDQVRAVVQPIGTNPDTSEGVTLSSAGLVTVTGTITDKDGDSSSATTNIGHNLTFQDDGPTISASATQPILTVDESNLTVNDTASFAGVFTSAFGADGAGSITYALGVSTSGVDSGLIDTATGNHVFLFLENGEVVGREGTSAAAAAGSGPVVFTVSIDSSGNVTLDQDRAVVHPLGTNPDTSEGVSLSSDGLVTITGTITDKDGDSSSATANIGTNLTFNDDGPTISASTTQPILTVDESNLSIDATSSFAGVFTSTFGADGAGSIIYALGVSASGADSGLIDTATGNHVFLFLENGQVVGREGASAAAAAGSGPVVFTVSVDSSGNVTLDQDRAVVHPLGTNPDTSEGVSLTSDGLVTLTGTITDKDGDSSTATANIGNNLVFQDDGPTISASTTQPSLTVDETNLAVNDTTSFAGIFTSSFGADGAGSITYALGVSTSGADSGLIDTVTGNHVFLFLENGEVVGREGTSAAAAAGSGPVVFTVSIDSSGNVTLDQDRAVVHPTGTNPDTSEGVSLASDGLVTITGTITDKDGDSSSATANIGKNLTFNDDGPTANPDTNSTAAGTTLTVTAGSTSDVLHNDAPGADGFASGGGVVGVATGTNTSVSLSTGVGTVIHGTFGDLTLNADGSYSYAAKPNVSGVDHFVYTVADGDGDTSTTTLNITVNPVTVSVGTASTIVSEEVLLAGTEHGGGTDSDSANDVLVNSGTIALNDSISGATFTTALTAPSGTFTSGGTTITWVVSNGGHTLTGSAGTTTILVATIDNSGHYTVTLSGPIDTPNGVNAGENGGDSIVTIGVTAHDNFGNTLTSGSLTVNVEDDAPTISASATQPALTVDETNLGANDSASFASVFTTLFGADGPATANSITYALGVSTSGADSGLIDTASGNHVFLFLESGQVVGREGADATAAATGAVVFTVSVSSSGTVTLDQDRAVVHPTASNPDTSEGVSLSSDGLVTLSATATDRDGDQASATASIGTNLHFLDDGPTISASTTQPTLTVDETNFTVNDTASFASVFTPLFGADGPATINSVTYALGVSTSGVDSGLVDTATGNHVFLFLENGQVVGREGTSAAAATGTGPIVFTVSVDSSGNVTLDQDRAVVHPTASNPDTNEGVSLSSDGLVTLTATATDKDGDQASATANIGSNLTFQDDGPTVSGTTTTEPTLSVDETDLSSNATASFAALFSASFGADGPATTNSLAYTLGVSTTGADSGLVDTATGNHVFLFVEGGEIVGREGADATAAASGSVVFTVSVDSSGSVTLDQERAVVHPDATNPDTNETVSLSSDGLITLTATATDKDGDQASHSVDIGQNLIFHDDGPTAINPAGIETDDVAQATIMASLDVSDNSVTDNFGADGPGSITFANITDGQDSGFTSGGTEITLWLSDNGQTLEGRINSTNGTDGSLVYTVHIDQANSQYDFTQSAVIDNGSGVSFNDLTSTAAGNVDFRGVGADSSATPVDLLLSGTATGGAIGTVNTDSTAIGVSNQSMDSGETLRIDFVTDLTSNVAGTGTGFGFSGHTETNGFIGLIPQVQGSQATTVSFTVYALESTLTQSGTPDSNPTGAFSDSTITHVTNVTVIGFDVGESTPVTVDISGDATGVPIPIAYGISVVKNTDGSVTFSGVQEGDHYGIGTSSNTFNAIAIHATGSFDIGTFALTQTNAGHTLNLNYDLQITDGDGDSVSVPGAIAIQLDPAGTTGGTPIITNTSTIHTQDVAHTALNTSSLIPSNDNLQQQGQRVFSVGQNAALMGAIAAAGLDAEHLALNGHQLALNVGDRPAMTPLETASLGSVTTLSTGVQQPAHSVGSMPVVQSAQTVQHGAPIHDMVESAHPLGGAASTQPVTMTQLLHGSAPAGSHATAVNVGSMTAPAVVMPSAQQLAAATANGSPQPLHSVAGNTPQHEQVVAKVLADALNGGNGHGQNVDALLHSLPVHAAGANGALQALASHAAAFVSIEHMGMVGPYGGPHSMLTVDMVMHQDAPPPAHG